jgi:hypothetical protein
MTDVELMALFSSTSKITSPLLQRKTLLTFRLDTTVEDQHNGRFLDSLCEIIPNQDYPLLKKHTLTSGSNRNLRHCSGLTISLKSLILPISMIKQAEKFIKNPSRVSFITLAIQRLAESVLLIIRTSKQIK